MKKVLTIVAVIALAASISSATTTLQIWTTLVGGVTSTPDGSGNDSSGDGLYNIDPSAAAIPASGIGPNMPLGLYGVQIWCQVLGETSGQGIAALAVSLYTGSNNAFAPVTYSTTNAGGTYNAVRSYTGDAFNTSGYTSIDATAVHMTSGLVAGVPNPGTGIDSFQVVEGQNGSAKRQSNNEGRGVGTGAQQQAGAPVLLSEQIWNLASLPVNGIQVTVNTYGTAETWTGSGNNYVAFDSVQLTGMVVPEPITVTLVGLGIVGLGGYIRRRTKVAA